MKNNNLYAFVIVAFLLVMGMAYANPTSVYVYPSQVTEKATGSNFTVSIKVDSVTDLAGFQLYLTWDPNVLGCVNAKGTPENIWSDDDNIRYIDKCYTDHYSVGYARYDPSISTFKGSATLATITFNVKNTGSSVLKISDILLGNSNGDQINSGVTDGSYGNPNPTTSTTTIPSSRIPVINWRIINLDILNILREIFARLFGGR